MQSKHAQTSLRPYGRDSGAHWTSRADGQAKPFPHLRAHKRIHPEADRIESSETVRVELDVLPRRFFVGKSPEINMFNVEHPRNQNVSRGTIPRTPLSFFPRAGTDNQFPTHKIAITPNARLNHRREAAELVLRMFQLHDQRPREENAMFRSSCLNLKQPAKIAPFFSCKTARPPNPAKRSHPKNANPAPHEISQSTKSRRRFLPAPANSCSIR